MLKYLAALLFAASVAHAAGNIPAVNQDMGCSDRQILVYDNSSGNIICAHLRLFGFTVSGLPACGAGTQGILLMVTDALTPVALATVVGGGAIKVPVVCNGTNWIVM